MKDTIIALLKKNDSEEALRLIQQLEQENKLDADLANSIIDVASSLGLDEIVDNVFDILDQKESIDWTVSEDQETTNLSENPLPLSEGAPTTVITSASTGQQRFFFLDQFLEKKDTYHEHIVLNLTGSLNEDMLQQAINQLIQRHESLRTCFLLSDEGIVQQVILPEVNLELEKRDLVGDAEFWDDLYKWQSKPFDLTHAPLWRTVLIRKSEEYYSMAITFHHSIIDGYCIPIILKEMFVLYEHNINLGNIHALQNTPFQYRQFAEWEATWMQSTAYQEQVVYWKNRLNGFESVLSLPTSENKALKRAEGSVITCCLEEQFKERVKQLSRSIGITPFAAYLGAYYILLRKYSQQSDITIGTLFQNRHLPDSLACVGYFVNTIPLRFQFNDDVTIIDFLKEVKKMSHEDFKHGQVPYNEIVNLARLSDASDINTDVFQTMFVLQGEFEESLGINNNEALKIETLTDKHSSLNSIKFDISFEMMPVKDGGMEVIVEYNRCHYSQEWIERFTLHYRSILEFIVDNLNQKLREIRYLSAAENGQQLITWNQTQADYPQTTIHQLFEEQVEKTPDNIAVVYEDEQLTYQQLNERANQVAHYLRDKGIGEKPDMLVAIGVKRSLEMMVGILAILKAGGAYVPLDPSYPEDRLRFMLEDTRASVLLTQSHLQEKWQQLFSGEAGARCELINLDQADLFLSKSSVNIEDAAHANDLAYVIYTSGSTGRPKGVMVEHKSIVNTIAECVKIRHVEQGSQVLQFASMNFDAMVLEWSTTLSSGASLYLLNGKDILASISHELKHHPIDIMFLTPSLLRHLKPSQCPSTLKVIIIAGEKLEEDLLDEWRDVCLIVDEYGPTEASVCTTSFNFDADTKVKAATIGRPLSNVNIYIMDRHGLLPVGVAGELYIGGAGLARGYLNRLDLTAERFITHQFTEVDEEGNLLIPEPQRLYRTGDLVRYLEDGNIEYIGRIDNQVKIRGFRIELGEIESQLVQLDVVQQAVVLAREDVPGNKQLVAYVVGELFQVEENLMVEEAGAPESKSSQEAEPSAASGTRVVDTLAIDGIKKQLKRVLPEYMVPSHIIALETMPLTANGKVDRKALPTPYETLKAGSDYVAPRTHAEQTLVSIWSELLNLPEDKIGIHANFFELGGDSIISIQMVASAQNQGLVFTVKQVFDTPTIAGLVLSISDQAALARDAIPAEQGHLLGEASMIPIQHWHIQQAKKALHHFNQSQLFEVREIDYSHLVEAVRVVVGHHDALRLRLMGDDAKQFISVEAAWQVEHCHYHLLVAESIESYQQQVAEQCDRYQSSLHLETGPVMQVVLFEHAEYGQRLFWVIHHWMVDGVSWRILLPDLMTAYQQSVQGKASHLITLGTKGHSVRQWAAQLREYANEAAAEDLDYWQREIPESHYRLPIDVAFVKNSAVPPAEANLVKHKASLRMQLSESETEQLLREVSKAYNTHIEDILLAALAKTLTDWNQAQGIVISLESHGREADQFYLDLSKTVGWFTTKYPVHLSCEVEKKGVQPEDYSALIKSIKEQLRAVPNKGLSYDALKYLSDDEATRLSLESQPTPEVVFNYLGQFNTLRQASTKDAQILSAIDLRPALESMGRTVSDDYESDTRLDINGLITEGQLSFDWSYAKAYFSDETIERLVTSYKTNLQAIIRHCCQPEAFGYTPSDFPLTTLNQRQLDQHFQDRNVSNIYPLSPLQGGLLFHSLLNQTSDAYVVQTGMLLRGEVNGEVFHRAWQCVLDRHDILRSRFVWDGVNEPVQAVYQQVTLPWIEEDWTELTGSQANDIDQEELSGQSSQQGSSQTLEERLDAWLLKDRHRGFDLHQVPLMRIALIKLEENRYAFVWTQHHILSDGWCLPIVFSEVMQAYQQLLNHRPLTLTMPRQYSDYITWVARQDLGQEEAFWTDVLSSITEKTHFPVLTNTRHEADSLDQFTIAHQLTPEQHVSLEQLARNAGVTLNTVVQTAWGLVLSRYCQQKQVTFGVTVSGRSIPLSDIEKMVGLFINTLPYCFQIDNGSVTILSLLKRIHRAMAQLNEHVALPLSRIQKLAPIQSEGGLFNSLYVYENYPLGALKNREQDNELGFTQERSIGREKTEYPLSITVLPDTTLGFHLMISKGLMNAVQAQCLIDHLVSTLVQFTQSPQVAVSELSLLSPQELSQQLVTWNQTQADYPQTTIHQLFEEQVEKTPDNIAVVYEDEQLTYQQLNERANQVAHYLRDKGIGEKPDMLVAIGVERSLEMMVGILAILKAGGAYVPLDPSYPNERLRYMLRDTKTMILLTQTPLILRFEGLLSSAAGDTDYNVELIQLICLDQGSLFDDVPVDNYSVDDVDQVSQTNSLAYVIYTSGSTGKPKGVMVEHHSIVNRLLWMQNHYQLSAEDVLLQKTPYSFDVSVWELFWSVLTGAKLVFAKPEGHKDTNYLKSIIVDAQVTTVHFVPSMLQAFLSALKKQHVADSQPTKLGHLKRIICSGEGLSAELKDQCVSLLDVDLENLYGPTEVSVDVSIYSCDREVIESTEIISIGRPIENIQLYVLDQHQYLLPQGSRGELYVGGVGLARGYLNRPELTTERFITHQFTEVDEEGNLLIPEPQRLYRTGDLVRYLEDGNIEYIGRIDNQVKIRGFRIELGEIESQLLQLDVVQQAVVLAREDVPGNKQLVAYVVGELFQVEENLMAEEAGAPESKSSQEDEPSATSGTRVVDVLAIDGIKKQLKRVLPEYMVPSHIIALETMPLTPNGKIDRKALPAPSAVLTKKDGYQGPRNEVERSLLTIWSDLLNLPESSIGIDDNFFDLGGHSLLVISTLHRINNLFGWELTVQQFFLTPTIAALAENDQSSVLNNIPQNVIPLSKYNANKRPLFLIHDITGFATMYQSVSEELEPLAIYGINYPNLLDEGELSFPASLDCLANDYLAQIKSISPTGPYVLGGYSLGGIVALEVARQLQSSGEEVDKVYLFDSHLPENIELTEAEFMRVFVQELVASLNSDVLMQSTLQAKLIQVAHHLEKLFATYSPKKLPRLINDAYFVKTSGDRFMLSELYSEKLEWGFVSYFNGLQNMLHQDQRVHHNLMICNHYELFLTENLSKLKESINTMHHENEDETYFISDDKVLDNIKLAIQRGNTLQVRRLVTQHSTNLLNTSDGQEGTLLEEAVHYRQASIVQWLIEQGHRIDVLRGEEQQLTRLGQQLITYPHMLHFIINVCDSTKPTHVLKGNYLQNQLGSLLERVDINDQVERQQQALIYDENVISMDLIAKLRAGHRTNYRLIFNELNRHYRYDFFKDILASLIQLSRPFAVVELMGVLNWLMKLRISSEQSLNLVAAVVIDDYIIQLFSQMVSTLNFPMVNYLNEAITSSQKNKVGIAFNAALSLSLMMAAPILVYSLCSKPLVGAFGFEQSIVNQLSEYTLTRLIAILPMLASITFQSFYNRIYQRHVPATGASIEFAVTLASLLCFSHFAKLRGAELGYCTALGSFCKFSFYVAHLARAGHIEQYGLFKHFSSRKLKQYWEDSKSLLLTSVFNFSNLVLLVILIGSDNSALQLVGFAIGRGVMELINLLPKIFLEPTNLIYNRFLMGSQFKNALLVACFVLCGVIFTAAIPSIIFGALSGKMLAKTFIERNLLPKLGREVFYDSVKTNMSRFIGVGYNANLLSYLGGYLANHFAFNRLRNISMMINFALTNSLLLLVHYGTNSDPEDLIETILFANLSATLLLFLSWLNISSFRQQDYKVVSHSSLFKRPPEAKEGGSNMVLTDTVDNNQYEEKNVEEASINNEGLELKVI